MNLSELTAISPVDGRYRSKVSGLAPYFSEWALIRYRVRVEIEYFIALSRLGLPQLEALDDEQIESLKSIYINFSEADSETVKSHERVTNHDVKAVEYFIKEQLEVLGFRHHLEFIHFGLTSQDINNTAVPLSLKEAHYDVYLPELNGVLHELAGLAEKWKGEALLARTHGQPASPTTVGKEIMVFVERLEVQKKHFSDDLFAAKFGGATGNFNAHHVAYPDIDWVKFATEFVEEELRLRRSRYTTQIEHYDQLAALLDAYQRINTILIDLCRDIWTYISMDYFKQRINKGEVGSSAMPHKVNPIDFENAEGNLGVANALFHHLARKLPVSRLQRDLTDSTVLRNIGVPFAHTLIAFKSIVKGLGKLLINAAVIRSDLEENWMVTAEAVQTILRREGYPKPYEKLKELTRSHESINRETMHAFIDSLDVSNSVKDELKAITPSSYTGITE